MTKGLLSTLVGAFSFAATAFGATTGASDDLWDVHSGVIVTATSGTLDSTASLGMFGGAGMSGEPGDTVFIDKPLCFVEWKTPNAVTVNHVRIFAAGDGAIYNNGREFGRFKLKIKSPGSTTFDTTVIDFSPTHPYTTLSEYQLTLDQTFEAITRKEFRAEFEEANLRPGFNGPRIIEMDAFGPPASPAITSQPSSTSVYAGNNASFSVTATGADPLSYTWLRNGTNVVLGDHFQITDGHNLLINNVRVEDAGSYTVHVTNSAGFADSNPATLVVNVDTNAPVVSITSPVSGTLSSKSVTLQGTFSDDIGVTSAHWEANGQIGGSLALGGGTFSVPITISAGETHLKVFATDAAGNVGSAEVVVALSPTSISSDDLWDVTRGTVVTDSSGLYPEQGGPGLFGGDGFYAEKGDTVFTDDKPEGFAHYIEWKTVGPVTISSVRVFAGGDGQIYNNEREFDRFTLKTKSPGSTNFDVTVFTFVPQHPYAFLDSVTQLILETNVPAFTAQEFRGEFVQYNGHRGYDGPRVIELDAFGPSSGGAPQIVNQPASKDEFVGVSTAFLVGATGAGPLTYQWRREGTNLEESAHLSGVHSWKLSINDLTQDDAGKYSVIVSNSLGHATSDDATLTLSMDTNAPVVVISSPIAGSQTNGTFLLRGTIQEDHELASAHWELNGHEMGPLQVFGGNFSTPPQVFQFGDNHIKVIAVDVSGNEGSAEVVANWTAPRVLMLQAPSPVQEGSRLIVPVSLMSTGGVAGATFVVTFDTNFLNDVEIEWSDSVSTGFTSQNLQSPRQLRASFALPGTALPGGSAPIALLNFRARSVPTNITTQLRLELAGIFADSGDEYTDNTFVQPTTATITKRKIVGDVNANDRLDVGDASLMLRLVSFLEPIRIWDRSSNDLNKNGNVDSGDVIKVLRAVVGLDPQPTVPIAPAAASKKSQLSAGSEIVIGIPTFDPVVPYINGLLVADKAMAAPGDKVTVEVHINGQTKPISGASFRLEYPADALRLDDATARQLGTMVPAGSAAVWSLSSSADFAGQNGVISLAVSSATAWPTNNGVLARFTFTVQPAATALYSWPIWVRNLEVSRDGFTTDALGQGSWTFTGHSAGQAALSPTISFNTDGGAQVTLHGDAGASFTVEVSTDLKNWSPFYSGYTPDGAITITDPANAETTRFYRAIQLPNQ